MRDTARMAGPLFFAVGLVRPGRRVLDTVRRLPKGNDELSPDHVWQEDTVRLYRPRTEIIDGRWKFPEAHPVQ
jgi:hypothetical protein